MSRLDALFDGACWIASFALIVGALTVPWWLS